MLAQHIQPMAMPANLNLSDLCFEVDKKLRFKTHQKGEAKNENARGHAGEVDLRSLYNTMFICKRHIIVEMTQDLQNISNHKEDVSPNPHPR